MPLRRLPPERVLRGSSHPGAVLDEPTVVQIKAAIAAGEGNGPIARRYGVSNSVIWYISRNKTWKHVPWPEGYQP